MPTDESMTNFLAKASFAKLQAALSRELQRIVADCMNNNSEASRQSGLHRRNFYDDRINKLREAPTLRRMARAPDRRIAELASAMLSRLDEPRSAFAVSRAALALEATCSVPQLLEPAFLRSAAANDRHRALISGMLNSISRSSFYYNLAVARFSGHQTSPIFPHGRIFASGSDGREAEPNDGTVMSSPGFNEVVTFAGEQMLVDVTSEIINFAQ